MTSQRLYHLCYKALAVFHWVLFFIVVEICFFYAGWMLSGLVGNFATWTGLSVAGPNGAHELERLFQLAGKGFGLLSGVVFTRYVTGRYGRTPN